MCSVVGCDSWRRSAQRFKLPEDPERRLEWVQFLATANKQRFKEASWTDITICSEHFKQDCFENMAPAGSVWLKPNAVPLLLPEVKQEQPEIKAESPPCEIGVPKLSACDHQNNSARDWRPPLSPQVPVETQEVASQGCQLNTAAEEAPASAPDASVQRQPKNVNSNFTEKITLVQMKGKYVVNEKHLIQLLKTKCPLCGSKVKVEKAVHGMLIVLNQQCAVCEYRNQWKSQVNATVPAAEEQQDPTEGTEVTLETASESEESSGQDQEDMDSDEDWKPRAGLFPTRVLREESDEETEEEEGEGGEEEEEAQNDMCLGYTRKNSQLCTDCGKFYSKRWPHTCEHKIKPYSCNICGKRCVSEVALNSHARVHNENYEHPCKYCLITFKTKVDKITHEQIHLSEGKPYKCPDCSETFASNKERRTHLEDHRGPKQLKCHICGIEFIWHLSLQRHMAVHTGEKPYKCSVCDRGFSQAGHLKSHMRLHTGERPFKCQHCDKCFNHNVSLKSHVQRYHTGGDEKREKIRSTDSEVDNREEEQDGEKEVQTEQIVRRTKKKKRSTGRPIGRPKSDPSGNLGPQLEGPDSKTKTKRGARRSKRKQHSDEEGEDSTEEEEEEEEEEGEGEGEGEGEESNDASKNTSKSRGQPKQSDTDSDFDPKDQKRKRLRSQSSGTSSGKRRGRPKKT